MIAWHLTAATLRDRRPLPASSEWLEHAGPIEACCGGLHASERLLDALDYAPDGVMWVHRVELDGELAQHGDGRRVDKVVARRRRILATYPLDLRRVVRLACEAASLAAWCAGLDLPDLVRAAEAADHGDWAAARTAAWDARNAAEDAAEDAAWAAWAARSAWAARDTPGSADWIAGAAARAVAGAAGDAAWVAVGAARAAAGDAGAAARAAGDAGDAVRAAGDAVGDCLEARAVALLTTLAAEQADSEVPGSDDHDGANVEVAS